jgi:hypothetical protein
MFVLFNFFDIVTLLHLILFSFQFFLYFLLSLLRTLDADRGKFSAKKVKSFYKKFISFEKELILLS